MSEAFIDAVLARAEFDMVEAELDAKGGGRVYVHGFRALAPGSGDGSRAMKALVETADAEGVTLVLFAQAEAGEGRLSQPDLEAWYLRHGFAKSDFFDHFEREPRPAPVLGGM